MSGQIHHNVEGYCAYCCNPWPCGGGFVPAAVAPAATAPVMDDE